MLIDEFSQDLLSSLENFSTSQYDLLEDSINKSILADGMSRHSESLESIL